jgi:tripartite-type tricarboxylate transporter receptor subunit TctC
MKNILCTLIFLFCASVAMAVEKIVILNPQGPSHSGTAQLIRVVDMANSLQNKYQFFIEFKVGGFESIALKQLLIDEQRYISTMTNASAEALDRKFIDLKNYSVIFSQGDSCWAVIALTGSTSQNLDSLKHLKELVVGGPAIGGATHITALELGQKYNIPVKYVVFRSNFDALVNMASNNGVNFIIERVKNFSQFEEKNSNMKILAMSCPTRNPKHSQIPTLLEQGISSPFIWQQIVAGKNMDSRRRQELADIFAKATLAVGRQEILEISDQIPPIFNNIDSNTHYRDSWNLLQNSRLKWRSRFDAN